MCDLWTVLITLLSVDLATRGDILINFYGVFRKIISQRSIKKKNVAPAFFLLLSTLLLFLDHIKSCSVWRSNLLTRCTAASCPTTASTIMQDRVYILCIFKYNLTVPSYSTFLKLKFLTFHLITTNKK